MAAFHIGAYSKGKNGFIGNYSISVLQIPIIQLILRSSNSQINVVDTHSISGRRQDVNFSCEILKSQGYYLSLWANLWGHGPNQEGWLKSKPCATVSSAANSGCESVPPPVLGFLCKQLKHVPSSQLSWLKHLTDSLLPLMNWKNVSSASVDLGKFHSEKLWAAVGPLHHPIPFSSPLWIIKKTKDCFTFLKVFLTLTLSSVALCHSDRRFRYLEATRLLWQKLLFPNETGSCFFSFICVCIH